MIEKSRLDRYCASDALVSPGSVFRAGAVLERPCVVATRLDRLRSRSLPAALFTSRVACVALAWTLFPRSVPAAT